ncbi:MAG: hypothetical protein OMM_03735 [Candidatus Magnetoglobus multicellularis str. Araruama]|uniref:Uncharacterized protein n=1 Tax=Candidatus Magnetoglobus multicellularis str. Araruama TaxID=890399 RepID=A0A1V1P4K3_9BACT|nr:MAG: hypothetical protein OMM_03735 [Candidatus Magnetoglobus multicellularis str. Araruama]
MPSEVGPSICHSGSHCYGTVLFDNYPPSANQSRLISPSINLPEVINNDVIQLQLWHWFSYSTNGKRQIQIIVFNNVTKAWYDWETIHSDTTSDSNGWVLEKIDLTQYATKKVRIGFLHYGYSTYISPGWYIDDVQITLSGTPIQNQSKLPIVKELNIFPVNVFKNTFELNACPLNYISRYLTPGQIDVSYETQIAMEGGIPPYQFTVLSGVLPSGLKLHETNGTIYGIPTKAGAYTFSLVCEGQNNMPVTREFSIEVTQKLIFQTQNQLPNATVNTDILIPILASGGKAPYTFSFVDGILPDNIQLNPNGMLSGNALVAGEYAFTVMVSDFNKNAAQKTFSLLMYPGTPPVLVTGDLNADESLEISDAIIALQILTNCRGVPVYMDEHIDMMDVLMIMQALSR